MRKNVLLNSIKTNIDISNSNNYKNFNKANFLINNKVLYFIILLLISLTPLILANSNQIIIYLMSILILIACLLDPAFGIYACFITFLNYRLSYIEYGITFVRIVVPIVSIGIWTNFFLNNKIKNIKIDKTTITIIIFFFYSTIISWINGYLNNQILAFFILTVTLRILINNDFESLNKILKYYVIAVIISNILGLIGIENSLYSIPSYVITSSTSGRFLGGSLDANEWSKFLLIAITICLFSEIPKNLVSRYIIIIFLSIGLLLTYSKMGILIFFLIILLFFIKKLLIQQKKIISFFLIITIFLLLLMFVWPKTLHYQRLKNRFYEYSSTNLLDTITTGRYFVYRASINSFLNTSPETQFFGKGYNSSRYMIQDTINIHISTHNVYLQILLDFGILGILLFFLILFKFISHIRNVSALLSLNGMLIITYLTVFLSLAWVFNWSNILFFSIIGTFSIFTSK